MSINDWHILCIKKLYLIFTYQYKSRYKTMFYWQCNYSFHTQLWSIWRDVGLVAKLLLENFTQAPLQYYALTITFTHTNIINVNGFPGNFICAVNIICVGVCAPRARSLCGRSRYVNIFAVLHTAWGLLVLPPMLIDEPTSYAENIF